MNAPNFKIIVVRGAGAGSEFSLGRRITRLGSDAGCDICIPAAGLAAHAASIEAAGEQITVYNRGDQVLMLAGTSVPPGDSGLWKLGADLLLPGDVTLRLEKQTAKAATPVKSIPQFEEESTPDESARMANDDGATPLPTVSSNAKSNTGPLIFIGACAVLIGLLILKKIGSDPNAPTASRVDALNWTTVWVEINAPKRLGDPQMQEVRRGLQHLYRHQKNDSAPENLQWKSRILQTLIAAAPENDAEREFNARLRGFVNDLD